MKNEYLYLRILSIFHYIVGGIMLLFLLLPFIILAMGSVGVVSSESVLKVVIISPESMFVEGVEPLPPFFGSIILGVGAFIYIFVTTVAMCMVASGYFLSKQKHYLFSLIVGCIECIFIPFGTVMGIFTVIVLSSDSVKPLYKNVTKEEADAV